MVIDNIFEAGRGCKPCARGAGSVAFWSTIAGLSQPALQIVRLMNTPPDRDATLAEWLDYQLANHPREIELGLGRVRTVHQRMGSPRPARRVITVAGTNGKGSTVAFLEALALAHGHRVATYTSPHLLRYEERVRIAGREVDADALVAAFADIEAARGDVTLTYFEWGTLAALRLMADHAPDLAVLEVGLGGRLDAVNIVDADVAVITSVDLDHQSLLGSDRETIGKEKAGVLRAGAFAVLAEQDPPASVLARCAELGCRTSRRGHEFDAADDSPGFWRWIHASTELRLPQPALAAPCQTGNAAAALQAFAALYAIEPDQAAEAMRDVRLSGRLQRIPGAPEWLLDVAHNPHAVGPLHAWLQAHPAQGRTHAVLSTLADKDVAAMVAPMRERIDAWHLAGLGQVGERDQPVDVLWSKLAEQLASFEHHRHADVGEAMHAARAAAAAGDRVVVFGSFHTVAAAMQVLRGWGLLDP